MYPPMVCTTGCQATLRVAHWSIWRSLQQGSLDPPTGHRRLNTAASAPHRTAARHQDGWTGGSSGAWQTPFRCPGWSVSGRSRSQNWGSIPACTSWLNRTWPARDLKLNRNNVTVTGFILLLYQVSLNWVGDSMRQWMGDTCSRHRFDGRTPCDCTA